MSEFFAKISGQFTGALLMSAFFPVLLFLTALTLVVLPITPYGHEFTGAVKDTKIWAAQPFVALIITVVVLAISVVLYNMNTQIVRLYEGYPWKDAWIAKLLLEGKRRRYRRAKLLRERINTLRLEVRLTDIAGTFSDARESQTEMARLMNSDYPDRATSVLPTRLGNVIRAFETYPRRQYGMAAIPLWPRLQALVDTNLASSLDSVKTSFDFMIHSAFLSGILAVLTAASGLYWQTRESSDHSQTWLVWTLVFGVISYLFYLASIARAFEWGTQVKTAFDLHRATLLPKMGYDLKPADLSDERRIWENLSYKLAFPDETTYPDFPYKPLSSYLIADPPSTIVKSTRTVKPHQDGTIEITLVVRNLDPAACNADRVIVREVVPQGKFYVCDSAKVDGVPAPLSSIDPIEIDLGFLPNGKSKIVVYSIKGATT